jgi:hypothetical protein
MTKRSLLFLDKPLGSNENDKYALSQLHNMISNDLTEEVIKASLRHNYR